jgi:superfamily II helicase
VELDEIERRFVDLEVSLRVLSELVKEELDLDETDFQEKADAVMKKIVDRNPSVERVKTKFEPKTSSEVVEYNDGTVEKNGSQFE